ncbi:MAG TPA: ABC transporter transmembrane domain-containing protein, partial [Planctomycetota bacterium]|nr:ABC transporter transmembrane domain-containing protein [Planctomycetota bacterium]
MWRILKRGWHYRWMLMVSILAAGGSGALMAYLLTKLGPFIKYLGGTEAAANPEQLARATEGLASLGITLIALTPVAVVTGYLAVWAGQWVANRSMEDIRGQVLGHLVRLDLAFHHSLTRGEMLSRLTNDLGAVLHMQKLLYGKLIQRPLESIGIIGFVMWHDWRLGIALVVILAPIVLILTPLIRRTRQRSVKTRATMVANFGVLKQITASIKVVKAMGSAKHKHLRYAAHNHKLFDDNMRLARTRSVSETVTASAVFAISGL